MNELEEMISIYWSFYNDDPELFGLTNGGFNGIGDLVISDFKIDQLQRALDFAHACGRPTTRFNKNHSSYFIKHVAERRAAKMGAPMGGYISNGALILGMVFAGFSFKRIEGSPNVYFNVSERVLKKKFKFSTTKEY